MTAASSPAPWSYDHSPYRGQDGREIPAFEVYDALGDIVFDTNEDTPCELQEQNARLAAAAPKMRQALLECVRLLADFDGADESDERSVYRQAVAAIATADGRLVRATLSTFTPFWRIAMRSRLSGAPRTYSSRTRLRPTGPRSLFVKKVSGFVR